MISYSSYCVFSAFSYSHSVIWNGWPVLGSDWAPYAAWTQRNYHTCSSLKNQRWLLKQSITCHASHLLWRGFIPAVICYEWFGGVASSSFGLHNSYISHHNRWRLRLFKWFWKHFIRWKYLVWNFIFLQCELINAYFLSSTVTYLVSGMFLIYKLKYF